jgi:DNA polymerase-3 subunit beta
MVTASGLPPFSRTDRGEHVRFQANRDIFSDAVSFVVKLLPQRTTLPILSGILIEASADIRLSSFDYEVSARTRIDADVSEAGRVLVSGRLLADIAAKLPDGPVSFVTESSHVKISCGSVTFTLLAMPVEEYPNIPEIQGRTGLVPAQEFANAISQVAVAASRDDVTPVITGVQLAVSSGTMSLVATDRYRVAMRDIEWESTAEKAETTALVPARTLSEIGRTMNHGETVSVSIMSDGERELIGFTAEDKTITSLLIKGNFPPVQRLFPTSVDDYAVMNTAELTESVRRVALVLEREAALRFSFSENTVTLEATGGEQAQASESVDAILKGEDTVVSLKPQFLLDALGAVHSEFVRIAFTKTDNPNKPGPVLITGQTSKDEADPGSYRYLLQPNLLLR